MAPCDMQDPRSLTRGTLPSAMEVWILNYWTAKEVTRIQFFLSDFFL